MTALNRRSLLLSTGGLFAGMAVAGLAGCSSTPTPSSTNAATNFDKNAFTELTTTVSTSAGDKEVVYHFWKPIVYVSKPVDADHQSLVISVPVRIDGKEVDASRAPIIFANAVGGYFPASVANAAGVGEAAMEMGGGAGGRPGGGERPSGMPPGGFPSEMPSGMPYGMPSGMPPGAPGADANAMNGSHGERINLAKLALASGYVVVEPGCRGRTLVDSSGKYYGVAPAALVDLKAAVQFLKANKDSVPGNTERIVTTGVSAGGALSSLLGASGGSTLYAEELSAIGAASGSNEVFASGAWCPITDLEHADGAYEWNWGGMTAGSGSVDPTVSRELAESFTTYQASLGLKDKSGTQITAANYSDYLLKTYLQPAASSYLAKLSEADRTAYLAKNTFISYANGTATFTWQDYLTHVGTRKKLAPAFDAFDLSSGENNLFGTGTTSARHFTDYSAKHDASGATSLDADIEARLKQMNPMYHLDQQGSSRTTRWWLRVGTNDTDTALTVVSNLALKLENLGDTVNTKYYWDEGHGANSDAEDFLAWVAEITV